jgi:hypothetical protein
MIEAFTACTNEIDDVNLAVSEVLAQMDKRKLRRNTVGILICYLDFIETGVVRALCEKLPFDVVGANSIGSAVPGNGGFAALSLLVLTSDDVFFSAALSRPLGEHRREFIEAAYQSALEGLPGRNLGPEGRPSPNCALGLTFIPYLWQFAGDEILSVLNDVSGGVPLFGMMAFDYSTFMRAPRVLFNGESYDDRCAIVLLSGNVHPRFTSVSIPKEKITKSASVVTDSDRNILKGVDGVPVFTYLENLGFAENGNLKWPVPLGLLVDYPDGERTVTLALLAEKTPDGNIVMGASVPVGSTFRIGFVEHGDVLASVPSVTKLIEEERTDVFLFFSCALRNFALGLDNLAEIERVREVLGDSASDGAVPYLFAYTGGEVCPHRTEDGRFLNCYHNMTAIGCAL